LPFLVKVGSLTVVARSASDVLNTVDRFLSDDQSSEPVVSTFEGSIIDIDHLRGLVGDPDES
jgi:serine phosphatase RsbU (regulator of sigma subunit)